MRLTVKSKSHPTKREVFKMNYPNYYDVEAKIQAGKQTNWLENAVYAGFTPDEIEAMIEANLE